MDNLKDALEKISYLENELEKINKLSQMMEEKMIEVMGALDYHKWSMQAAKDLFAWDVERLPEGDFKNFCKVNMKEITI